MEAVEVPEKAEDVRLLLSWDTAGDQSRSRRAGTFSIAAHIIAIVILLSMPREVFRVRPQPHRLITPLVFPPKEPTQREPNTEKVSKSFNVESLLPRPKVHLPASAPSTTRPRAMAPPPTPASKPSLPASLPEPPKVDAAVKDFGPRLPDGVTPAPAPPPRFRPKRNPSWLSRRLAGSRPAAVRVSPRWRYPPRRWRMPCAAWHRATAREEASWWAIWERARAA